MSFLAATLLAFFVYLVIFMKLPSRVYIPLTAQMCAILILWSGREANILKSMAGRHGTQVLGIAVGIYVAIFSIAFLRHEIEWSPQYQARTDLLVKSVGELNPRPHQLYVTWGRDLGERFIGPFQDLSFLEDIKLLTFGALTQSAYTRLREREFEVDDLFRALSSESCEARHLPLAIHGGQ